MLLKSTFECYTLQAVLQYHGSVSGGVDFSSIQSIIMVQFLAIVTLSLLCIISKMLEHIVYVHLNKLILTKYILTDSQFGFCH